MDDLVARSTVYQQFNLRKQIMLKSIVKLAGMGLLATAVASMPLQLWAQGASTNAPTEKKEPSAKKQRPRPFHGNLAAVDKTAKTIKVGESTYQIIPVTRILKDGKPATLDDGVVGEPVSGYARPTEDGKFEATRVNFGKVPEKGSKAPDAAPKQDAAPK